MLKSVAGIQLFVIGLLLVMQAAMAETAPGQQDFAFVATLSEGKQSLRQFDLPYTMLAKLARQDYGDMRIFNSQNQLVPFNVTHLEPQTQQNNLTHALRFFRLGNNADQKSGGLQIEFNENTARFNFNSVTPEHEQAYYLMIENQHQDDALQAIKLIWQQPGDAFSVNVKLESSDNLQNWELLNNSITLYALKYSDYTLTQNSLLLSPASHAKYLRLSFHASSNFSLQIEKIIGEYYHSNFVERENWQTFPLVQGQNPNEWLFNTGSFIPVTKIGFEIPKVGLFFQGRLYSKDDSPAQNLPKSVEHISFKREVKRLLHRYPEQSKTEQNDWRYQETVKQYRLLTAAGEIESQPIRVLTTKDRQWKLVLDQPATLLPEQVPSVKIAWHPVIVTFLAQGNPPYQLFLGNAAVAPSNAMLSPELNNNAETVNALTVRSVEHTAEPTEPARVLSRLNWQKILLWLLLCVGVLIIGLMVYQLYLRINRGN